jgi:hypothetical protein
MWHPASAMRKTSVYLTDHQAALLHQVSLKDGRSRAEVIPEGRGLPASVAPMTDR